MFTDDYSSAAAASASSSSLSSLVRRRCCCSPPSLLFAGFETSSSSSSSSFVVVLLFSHLVAQSVAHGTRSSHSARPMHGRGTSHSGAALDPQNHRVEANDVYLAKGMRGRIDCPLRADPPHTLIVWIKENRPLAIDDAGGRLRINHQGSLLVRRADVADQGFYACVAYSPLEQKQRSPLVHVHVKDLPYFTLTPKPFYQKQLSQLVHMPCIASGDPSPTISWQKISGRFPVQTRILQDGGNLTIARLTKEDEGLYQCLAVNLVASIVTTSLLLIEVTTQHGPTNVTVETTVHTATISWYPAYDGGRPVRHVICYRIYQKDQSQLRNRLNETRSLGPGWECVDVPSNDTNVVTVHNLFADSSYQFLVLSNLFWSGRIVSSPVVVVSTDKLLHDVGASTIAIPSHGLTNRVEPLPPINHLPGHRPLPPTDVRVTQQADGGLLLRWAPPKASPVPVAYYSIEYRTVGQWVPLGGGGGGGGEAVVRNVTYLWKTASRGVTYHFRVKSHGRESQSSRPSEAVTINTGNPSEGGRGGGEGGGGEGGGGGSIYRSGGAVATVCVVVAVTLSFVAVYVAIRLVARVRRTRSSSRHSTSLRYENVKYCGPNHHEYSPKTLVAKGPVGARHSLIATVLGDDVVSNSLNDHSTDRLHLHGGCCDHEHGTPSNETSNHREVIQVEATV